MNLADAVASIAREVPNRCRTFAILNALSPEDRATADRLLADPEVQSRTIAHAMRLIGYEIANQSLARHRRGECRCTKSGL